MLQQRLMWIIWPAFLMAGVLEMLVFAMVDPQDLQWFGSPLEWSQGDLHRGIFCILGNRDRIQQLDHTPGHVTF